MSNYYYDMVSLRIGLIRFYHDVVRREMPWFDFDFNLQCLQRVRDAYSKNVLQSGSTDIRFELPAMRSAYMFLNSPLFCSTVAHHFLNLLHVNPWLLRSVTTRSSLKICCLGGGPASEAVAIAKSLEMVRKMLCVSSAGTRPIEVHVTVVDIDPSWKETTRKITQMWWRWIDQSVVKLKLSFVQADLTRPLNEEVRQFLGESDVVTMVKFLSAVYGSNGRERISGMLQEIFQSMRETGILFLVNSSRFSCVESLVDVISGATSIYGPIYYLSDSLCPPALQECFRLYCRCYGTAPPTVQCKNHVGAWQKRTNHSSDESGVMPHG